ncbi:flagellar FliJ family protein [Sulfurimonas sp. SAG-AH-194-C20]|nr:flagellar export protein FliJ [Sulfurimonas sp. SAG-AH-194-C20]MDF1879302.1 flagellar FliJ family protein [Sulfurimonas sp. SAG-AH-194-C20]
MKTRYTSLVSVKKNIMQRSEQVLQTANANLNNALVALELSFKELQNIPSPTTGQISEFLSARTLLDSQRAIIQHNQEWAEFARVEIRNASAQLKLDMVEYEKFNYLDLEEIKIMLQKQKYEEAKELDEIALMTYKKRNTTKEFS